jgi:hypothetical protein
MIHQDEVDPEEWVRLQDIRAEADEASRDDDR